jgi:glutathione S-transferase
MVAMSGRCHLTLDMLQLFDLAGRDDRLRFSPFCWRTKMALLHKGLDFQTTPWRFTEKEVIARTGQGRVPVLIDGNEWIHDSWSIADYLDSRYPDRPALMASASARAAALFVNSWCDATLHPALRPLVFLDVFNAAAEKDRGYFRENREKLLGQTLEQLCADRDAAMMSFLKTLAPAEAALRDSAYLGGQKPNYSDYALFGSLQWARCVSGTPFLPAESATCRWFNSLLDLHGGFGRKAPTMADLAAA